MIRINLLPHRELKRERRKKEFVTLVALTVVVSAAVAFLVGQVISQSISAQHERNRFIEAENGKLDAQIKEIASLRQEIESLKARQRAVENLQTDRTTPVHLLDELVKHTPDGIYLKQLKQEERKVTLTGYAQSNERVSEMLRNLANNAPWFSRPELIEIKSSTLGRPDAKDARRVFEFAMTAMVKNPAQNEREGTQPQAVRKVTSAEPPARVAAAR